MATRDNSQDLLHIEALRNERMKTYAKKDAQGRVEVLYEAPLTIEDGDDCLATVYFYVGASSSPVATKEKTAIWDGAWDTDTDAILVNGNLGYIP